METNSTNEKKTFLDYFFLVLGIATVIYVCVIVIKDDTPHYSNCYVFAQELVKDELKSPSTAKFPKYDKDFFSVKDKTVTVKAYVDAQNSLGATVRTDFTATIAIDSKGEPIRGYVTLS